VTTNWIGVECNEEDVAQFFRNDLETHMRCAALNRFPEDKHLILNRNVGLLQLVIVCIVHTFEGLFANTAGIQYHGSNGNAHRIVAVGLDPSAMGWKLNAYGAIDKRLNAGGKGSPFIR
jgi:hypothetical protein